MHQTHDLPLRFYWHTLRLVRTAPLHHVASTTETEEPYRVCDRVHILRVPLSGWALAVGRWEPEPLEDEDRALLRALLGREDSPLDESGHIEANYESRLQAP